MADIVFDKQKGVLRIAGKEWDAVSGTQEQYDPIPSGRYKAPKNALMAGRKGLGVPFNQKYSVKPYSYKDERGLSWFLWLGKGELGIHPDGNIVGTKGCIGVSADNTRSLFEKLKRMNNRELTIIVK